MDYVVIDFETGGLDNQVHALLSVGVLVLDHDLRELFRYYTLIKDDPIKLVDQAALDVNGITLEEIKTGLPIEQVINNLRFLIGEQVVVAHNAAFDVGFLNKRGFNITHAVDTMFLSWQVWPKQKAKLKIVCERMGIPVEKEHNSLGDVLLTAEALRWFKRNQISDCITPKPIDFEWFKR